MDYEKKYKEALERARKLKENPQSVFNEYSPKEGDTICDYIFPELKESENEKVRKAIIELVKQSSEVLDKQNQSNMLAWLEKQNSNVDNANKEYWRGYREGKQEFVDKYAELEKQSEEKPRYSIGDVLCDKSCTTLNKDAQPNFEIIDIRNGMYICDKCSFPISQQDEYELVAKRIEQESAWSEEDESWFKELELMALSFSNDVSYLKKFFDWLKSLKQRIEWKPSDEQITVLELASKYERVFTPKQIDILIGLKEQLKKLKGE